METTPTLSRRSFLKLAGWLSLAEALPKPDTQDLSSMRGITYYLGPPYDSPSGYLPYLERDLPDIVRARVNTLKLVTPWYLMQPDATTGQYNDREFSSLRQTLQLLSKNDLKCFLGLNYLDTGWTPKGINRDNWITDPKQYAAFETYATHFLEQIADYSDSVYIVVFTEGTEPYPKTAYNPLSHTAYLRKTLGSLPDRLPPYLRQLFTIGFHDYSLITLGWAKGRSPIATPSPFDFLSMTAYGFETSTRKNIWQQLDTQIRRFHQISDLPLIIGELGVSSLASHSGSSETNQARAIRDIIEFTLTRKIGFNIWSWQDSPLATDQGVGLKRPDATSKPAFSVVTSHLADFTPHEDLNRLGIKSS